MRKLHVAVLYGGQSNEREVSIMSARAVMQGLQNSGHSVAAVEISKKGEWILKGKSQRKINPLAPNSKLKQFDLIFIALHGSYGEDGTVQAILNTAGVRYTGSGLLANALGFDKLRTADIVRSAGVFVPRSALLFQSDSKQIGAHIKKIGGFPCVVKPNRSGSSIGVSIVSSQANLSSALRKAFREDHQVVIQEYIVGIELTCGVLGNTSQKELQPLPPVEILPSESFFDYHAKYFSKRTQELCPAPIGLRMTEMVQNAAMTAHRALGCDGLTRSDFILKKNKLYFLEINTLPGLTPSSLCPKEAFAAGMTFERLLDVQIDLALKKT